MTVPTDPDGDEDAILAEMEAGFAKLAQDSQALAAYRAESQEISELIDGYSGCLDTDGHLRTGVDELRSEWRKP